MAFGVEQGIDVAALRMKVDPIALAQALGSQIRTASGCTIGPLDLEVWRNRKSGDVADRPLSPRRRRRHRLLALSLAARRRRSKSRSKGGRLIASTATQDIGQGSRTVIANTVAREFGLEPHEVEVRIGDSRSAGRTGRGRQPQSRPR